MASPELNEGTTTMYPSVIIPSGVQLHHLTLLNIRAKAILESWQVSLLQELLALTFAISLLRTLKIAMIYIEGKAVVPNLQLHLVVITFQYPIFEANLDKTARCIPPLSLPLVNLSSHWMLLSSQMLQVNFPRKIRSRVIIQNLQWLVIHPRVLSITDQDILYR